MTAIEMKTTAEQRIYIACLAAYNNGILHGEWIDINGDIDDTWNRIRSILASSPIPHAEEWAIHDFEGFGGIRLSEWESIERVHKLADFIQEHGEAGMLALSYHDGDLGEAQTLVGNYAGCFSSIADYAQEITESTSEIPEHLEAYIDYERIGRDMDLNGEIVAVRTGYEEVHIFLNC